MRRLAAVFLVFALTACGGPVVPEADREANTATPEPSRAELTNTSLTCDSGELDIGNLPSGVERAGTFARVKSLREQLKVKGVRWRRNDEELLVAVVCGVHGAERFATLVSRSSLGAYHGKPALRWSTRGGLSNFMWLERPGTAVYIGATPGLARDIEKVAAGVG
ncbi:MAG TPA: hypothetical protein VM347_36920 [Nonomuraea sp.]|nr:hypothetical protein [Nonomuraea sp.]